MGCGKQRYVRQVSASRGESKIREADPRAGKLCEVIESESPVPAGPAQFSSGPSSQALL